MDTGTKMLIDTFMTQAVKLNSTLELMRAESHNNALLIAAATLVSQSTAMQAFNPQDEKSRKHYAQLVLTTFGALRAG